MTGERMHAGEIADWLREHKGQKSYQEKTEEVANPDYVPGSPDARLGTAKPKNIVKHNIWVANDGQVLEVIDNAATNKAEQDAAVAAGEGGYQGDTFTPYYRVVHKGDPDNIDPRSPEKKAEDAAQHAEAEWNRANGPTPDKTSPAYNEADAAAQRGSGLSETHAERAARELRERTVKREEDDATARRNKEVLDAENRGKELGISQQQADETERAHKASEAAAANQLTVSQAQADAASKNADTTAAREARDARTPNVIGTPTDTQQSIAWIDPTSGEIKAGENPLYNQKKAEAEQERERLRLLIENNKMTAEVAAAQYKRWYDQNIAGPLALAAERRAQAAEQRQALQAEDQRRQFKATNDIARADLGEKAAGRAVDAEKSLLPYRVGGGFAGDFSDAINGLAAGGKMGTNASAGVHFQAGDFEFKAPNYAQIARNATTDALKHLTPYKPSDQPYQVANYTGLTQPTSSTLAGAPAEASYADTSAGITALPNYAAP